MAVRVSHPMKVYGAWLFRVPRGTTLEGLASFPPGYEESGWTLIQMIPGQFEGLRAINSWRITEYGTYVNAIGKGETFEAEVFTV